MKGYSNNAVTAFLCFDRTCCIFNTSLCFTQNIKTAFGFQCHLSHSWLCLSVWHECTLTSTLWNRHTCPVGLRSLAAVISIFSNIVQTGEKLWPSTLLSEPVHHCHSGSVVQNSSVLSRRSPPDWTCTSLAPDITLRSPRWQPAAAADSSLLALLWADASTLGAGGRLLMESSDRYDWLFHTGILTPRAARSYAWRSNVLEKTIHDSLRENVPVLQFTGRRWWCECDTYMCCNGSTAWPDPVSLQSCVLAEAVQSSPCTTCVNSIIMAGVSSEGWIFQTNHNRQ